MRPYFGLCKRRTRGLTIACVKINRAGQSDRTQGSITPGIPKTALQTPPVRKNLCDVGNISRIRSFFGKFGPSHTVSVLTNSSSSPPFGLCDGVFGWRPPDWLGRGTAGVSGRWSVTARGCTHCWLDTMPGKNEHGGEQGRAVAGAQPLHKGGPKARTPKGKE